MNGIIRIKENINKLCQKHGINYCSDINKEVLTIKEDSKKLSDIYLQLKEIVGELVEIEERHNFPRFHNKIDKIIKEMEQTDHEIINLATVLKIKSK
jgi:galactitol-specific phosphotransferase system IIB component